MLFFKLSVIVKERLEKEKQANVCFRLLSEWRFCLRVIQNQLT